MSLCWKLLAWCDLHQEKRFPMVARTCHTLPLIGCVGACTWESYPCSTLKGVPSSRHVVLWTDGLQLHRVYIYRKGYVLYVLL